MGEGGGGAAVAAFVVVFYVPERIPFYAPVPFVSSGAPNVTFPAGGRPDDLCPCAVRLKRCWEVRFISAQNGTQTILRSISGVKWGTNVFVFHFGLETLHKNFCVTFCSENVPAFSNV